MKLVALFCFSLLLALTVCTGEFKFMDLVGEQRSFEMAETVFRAEEKPLFLDFIRGMVQWRPEDRKTAKELLEDPWLNM